MPPIEDGGSPVTSCVLEYADGLSSTSFTAITTYDGTATTFAVSKSALTLTTGNVYKFRIRAVNAIGNGEYSDEVSSGLIDLPTAPATPTKLSTLSNKTTVTIQWAQSTDGALTAGRILGYKVYMVDVTQSSIETMVYNGQGYPNTLLYQAK